MNENEKKDKLFAYSFFRSHFYRRSFHLLLSYQVEILVGWTETVTAAYYVMIRRKQTHINQHIEIAMARNQAKQWKERMKLSRASKL